MKCVQSLSMAVMLFVMLVQFAAAQEQDQTKTVAREKPWIDLVHCDFCKNMAAQPGLMDPLKCDTIKIENGMMTVAFVPDELKESLSKANAAMEETAKRMMAGEKLNTCGFCESIGFLMMKGAKMERKNGDYSEVTFFTSDNPVVIKLIHEMADKTIAFNKAQQERSGHEHTDATHSGGKK